MQLSSYSAYALWIVRILADNDKPVIKLKLAERLGIDEGFVQQILRRLMKAGLVKSLRGFYGGYIVGDKPRDITWRAVIEAAAERPMLRTEKGEPELLSQARELVRGKVVPVLDRSILEWPLSAGKKK